MLLMSAKILWRLCLLTGWFGQNTEDSMYFITVGAMVWTLQYILALLYSLNFEDKPLKHLHWLIWASGALIVGFLFLFSGITSIPFLSLCNVAESFALLSMLAAISWMGQKVINRIESIDHSSPRIHTLSTKIKLHLWGVLFCLIIRVTLGLLFALEVFGENHDFYLVIVAFIVNTARHLRLQHCLQFVV